MKFCTWVGLLLMPAHASAQLSHGLYAVFHTSLGGITTRLHQAEAPMAVANFIGLVEGSQGWIEEVNGIPTWAPYYDGLIVNRIAELNTSAGPVTIVQSGSQNGTNAKGGPGYTFQDELPTTMTHTTGTLSMANSGPNSNGSQFFFCLGDLPYLDTRHSIFGSVIGGLSVLEDIGNVALTNNKPVTDVVFNQVEILRVGPDAEAFDPLTNGLPSVQGINLDISSLSGGLMDLVFPVQNFSQTRMIYSQDLGSWTEVYSAWDLDNTLSNLVTFAVNNETANFFAATQVLYPPSLYTPFDFSGATLTTVDTNGDLTMELQYGMTDTNGTGTVTAGTNVFFDTLVFWDWDPQAYSGELLTVFGSLNPGAFRITLVFTNNTSGKFAGNFLFSPTIIAFATEGTFTFNPTP